MTDIRESTDWQHIPAFTLPLQGTFLIEASAGTGKTWTLSNLMSRLLVEGGYATSQILATTFTRAAAGELAERIRHDLEESAHVFKRLSSKQIETGGAILPASAQLLHRFWLSQIQSGHLTLTQLQNRLELALITLDDLFVGTLDSLCQKLLREFALESGAQGRLQIVQDEDDFLGDLIHDQLRAWRQDLYQRQPQVLQLLVQRGLLTDIGDHLHNVKTILNFPADRLAASEPPEPDWQAIDLALAQLKQVDISALEFFYNPTHPDAQAFSYTLKNHGKLLPQLQQRLASLEQLALAEGHILSLLEAFTEAKITNQIKVKYRADLLPLIEQHPLTAILRELYVHHQQIHAYLKDLPRWLTQVMARQAHDQLPVRLAERGATTFSLQMRLLADLLASQPNLGAEIRQRYPVILIDEFQDTNHDQLAVLQHTYLADEATEQIALYLVGDPKQAIYGFRGGDVQTYLQVKGLLAQQPEQIQTLAYNQRSVPQLVRSVNRLFESNAALGEQIDYESIVPGERPLPVLVDDHDQPVTPLQLRVLEADQDALEACAAEIAHLLQQPYFLAYPDGKKHRLQAKDIAVLTHSHHALKVMQDALTDWQISCQRQGRESVFSGHMARLLLSVLQAWLKPHRDNLLRRLLASALFGWTLEALDDAGRQPERVAIQQQLEQQGRLWQRGGLMTALNQLWRHQPQLLERLAGLPEGARLLTDLRQLSWLLYDAERAGRSPQELVLWLQQQIRDASARDDSQIQLPLPASDSVTLMTIFASKGLEFPVVFCPTLQDHRKHYEDVYYGISPQGRRVIATQATTALQDQHRARHEAEDRRLAYVAMTRAAQALYLYVKPSKAASNRREGALWHWLYPAQGEAARSLPDQAPEEWVTTLQDWMTARDITAQVSSVTLDLAPSPTQAERGEIATLTTRAPLSRRLNAWYITSFTGLKLQQQGHSGTAPVALLNDEDDIDSSNNERDDNTADETTTQVLPARFRYPKGTEAGTLLHVLLETLPLKQPEEWLDHVAARLKQHERLLAGQPVTAPEMLDWFGDILQAVLPDEARLGELDATSRQAELHFDLHLPAHVQSAAVRAVLNEQPFLQLDAPIDLRFAQYLTGAIDLVYHHRGRYYICDYKSNFISNRLEDYHAGQIEANMRQHDYFLQATLYLVALHRLLQQRLPNYDPTQHLGGAVYLYVRGMQAGQQQGVYHWQPDLDWLQRFDLALGGKPQGQAA